MPGEGRKILAQLHRAWDITIYYFGISKVIEFSGGNGINFDVGLRTGVRGTRCRVTL